jgi:error-prone DNA polymerase
VEVRPPDVNLSAAKCSIEDGAVRIGFEYVERVGEDDAKALVAERERGGPFRSVVELAQRAPLSQEGLESLLASGACDSFRPFGSKSKRVDRSVETDERAKPVRPGNGTASGASGPSRRALLWELGLAPRSESVPGSGGEARQLALPLDPTAETPKLPEQTPWERMLADYRRTSLSVGVHPLELLRPHLPAGVLSSHDLCQAPDKARVAVAGMAVARQRPATANGVVFMLLEDEFGQMNLIVPPPVYERHRAIVRGEPLVLARGTFERVERNQNVVVRELETLAPLARQISGAPDLASALPEAHHFGHR